MSVQTFLNTVFATKHPDHYLLIWEKQQEHKISNWFTKINKAVACAERIQTHDVYVGCGVSKEDLGPHRRCRMGEIVGIPGLWLDIDLLDLSAHKKENLPPTMEEAWRILEEFPYHPTVVVGSGHGMQCWWVFDQFYLFNGSYDNSRAAKLLHDFTFSIRSFARVIGYDVDMTFDLSRVFRIPGTKNHKTETPVPVKIMEMTGRFFSRDDIMHGVDVILAKAQKLGIDTFDDSGDSPLPPPMPVTIPEPKDGALFILNTEAEPPALKFSTLLEAEPRFKASWQLKRTEFKDQSPSSYDYSLATFALQSGWTWQETVNLLVAFRRVNNLPQKLRYDYYYRTLFKASETIKSSAAEERIDEILTDIKQATDTAPILHKEKAQEKAPDLLVNISEVFGVVITRIVRYKTDPPEYRLETPHGNVGLGPIQNLIEQNLLRRKIADATKHFIPPIKKDRWLAIAQALLNALVDEDIGEEATDYGIVKTWLLVYMQECEPLYDHNDAIARKRPFFRDKHLHLFGPELRQFLSMYYKEQNTAKTMGRLLKEFGFRSASMAFRRADDETRFITRNVWAITVKHPLVAQFYDPHEDKERKEDQEEVMACKATG